MTDKAGMADSFRGRDFLSLNDYKEGEIYHILDLAAELKDQLNNNIPHPLLKGKTLGMIFQKSSTRTRISFEVGMYQLGGYPLFLSSRDLQLGRGETIGDTGKVFSRYLDGIMIRTYDHDEVVELAEAADIPVINGLTDLLHPCQALADLMTIREYKGGLKGVKLAYLGDGNNMAHSLMIAGAKMGMHIALGCPQGYEPSDEISEKARTAAKLSGAEIQVYNDPHLAVEDAHVIYTDVWASMGQEEEAKERAEIFKNYQVNSTLVKGAAGDAMIMHCLPAHRGWEISGDVIDGPKSVVFHQAENRLHAQKAVMALLMSD
ncbi:MAG: ornithine carbamoyltransferase [Clostridia bacterium]|nr:ornithine carbamoyltransferase [Clostridia bacterium]